MKPAAEVLEISRGDLELLLGPLVYRTCW